MIPASAYTGVYYNILLTIVLITAFWFQYANNDRILIFFCRWFGWLFLLFVVLYMGMRPISHVYFGDMGNYARDFQSAQISGKLMSYGLKEWFFTKYIFYCSLYMNVNSWFLLTTALYVGLAALAFRIVHKDYAYVAFLMYVASFSFWSYGTNGIRNGLAVAVALLGMACRERKWLMASLFFLAPTIHRSTLIPVAAFVMTIFFKRPRFYLLGYVLAIILSVTMGGWWQVFFVKTGLFSEDARFIQYLTKPAQEGVFSRIGFRWDFLLYSLWPIVTGWYYLVKKRFQDPFYTQLFNAYIAANAFWILVIRANYSNRIAFLSWFMMSWVIIYPLLKEKLFVRQNAVIARTLVAYFAFTYFMFMIKRGSF